MSRKSGFTLIEILVVVSIFAVLTVIIAQIFFSVIRLNAKAELVKEVKQNGDFAILAMSRMVRNAVNVRCSDYDPNYVQSISLDNPDGGTTTFTCASDGDGTTHIASSSADLGDEYLTNTNVSMGPDCENSYLYFKCTTQGEYFIGFLLSQKSAEADPCPITDPGALATDSGRQQEKSCIWFSTSTVSRN